MGCAYVKKIDIKKKDVDLSGEITKTHFNEVNINLRIEPKKETGEIMNIEKFNFRNLEKSNNSNKNIKVNKINQKIFSKSKSLTNVNEFKFSGPIISLLKNKVDNYQKKTVINKVLIVNAQTNISKEN